MEQKNDDTTRKRNSDDSDDAKNYLGDKDPSLEGSSPSE